MLADSPEPNARSLTDRAVISTPLTVTPETLIGDAIATMHQAKTSYVLITEQQRPIGIFTERDLLQLLASDQPTVGITIATVMTTEVRTITAAQVNDIEFLIDLMRQHQIRHLPIVDAAGRLNGIITQNSLLEALIPSEIKRMLDRLQPDANENQAQIQSHNQQLVQDRHHLSQQLEAEQTEHQFTKAWNRGMKRDLVHLSGQLETKQAEHHQAESHIQFQAKLLNTVAQAVIATDLDGQIIYWNRFAETLYGWSAAEVLGHPILDVIPADTTHDQATKIMAHLQRGEQWSGEFWVKRKDGNTFPAWVIDAPIYDDQGTLVGIVGASKDISARKRIESERQQVEAERKATYRQLEQSHKNLATTNEVLTTTLQELQIAEHQLIEKTQDLEQARQQAEHEQQRYQELFNFAPDGYLITNMAGKIQEANQAAAAMLCPQGSSDYLTGLPLRLFVDRTQLPFFRTCINQVRQAGRVNSFELRLKPSQATQSFPAAIKVSGILEHQGQTAVPGQLIGIRWLIQDISELKQAEQALQQSNANLENRVEARTAALRHAEQRWRNLLENVHLTVIGLNCDGTINYANPFLLNLTGYTATDVLGKDWFELFLPPSQQPLVRQYFQQLLSQPDSTLRYQNPILTQSGEQHIIDWNNTVLRNGQNNVIGTMSIGEDITERFAIDRMKGEFISVISHELRTPLTAIHGGIKLLARGLVPVESDEGQQLLQLAAEHSQRLVRLVNDILELERLESGTSLLQKQPLNTHTLTSQVVGLFQLTANQAGITLEVSDPGFEIIADCDRIHQVLTNLMDNAIKFSPADSTIWLTVESGESDPGRDTVLFTVRDQGRGIPPEKCAKIFERFIQVDSSDSREKGGTGLGLTICQNIVEQHGGSIGVKSTPGKGSCFYFTLPIN